MAKLDYDKLNATTRYMMISAFAVDPGELGDDRADVIDDAATFLKQLEEKGAASTTWRGCAPTRTT